LFEKAHTVHVTAIFCSCVTSKFISLQSPLFYLPVSKIWDSARIFSGYFPSNAGEYTKNFNRRNTEV